MAEDPGAIPDLLVTDTGLSQVLVSSAARTVVVARLPGSARHPFTYISSDQQHLTDQTTRRVLWRKEDRLCSGNSSRLYALGWRSWR